MADEILIFDAAGSGVNGENPGSALSIGPGTSYPLVEASFPAPPQNVLYASSIDTEGENPVSERHGNRTITLRFAVDEASAVNTLLDALAAKFAKLQREGGTLHRTRKDGTVRIYDIVAGDGWEPSYDVAYLLAHSSEVPVQFPAKPYMRGAEQDLGDNTETTLPCLVFTEASVPGDVPALGRLVIDNDDASNDQWWVVSGIQSRYYDAGASAALFYEAEGRTAMGGSATAVGPSGASGAGSNVMRNTALATTYQAILSTQASGGGAHLSHIGTFRVFARFQAPTSNTGTVTVGLEWGDGDFRRYTQNATTDLDPTWEGTWRLVDLGLVNIPKVVAGTQRWEGRILAKSTVAGDDIDVDWLMLVPTDEGSGEASAVNRLSTATSFTARDEFDQTSGNLTGKTLPVGGTWAGAGDADDFTINTTTHAARRDAPGADTDYRFGLAGTGTLAGVAVSASVTASSATDGSASGVFCRYVDVNNFAGVLWPANGQPQFNKRLSGTVTTTITDGPTLPVNGQGVVAMTIDAGGRWAVYAALNQGTPRLVASGQDADFVTGGTLASGRYGIIDEDFTGASNAREVDNFAVWAPVADAAMFASQSLEIRYDRVVREDSSGTLWLTPSKYVGDYLRVPASGAEARTTRVIVKASRNIPGEGADSGTDDISARLFVTPRYLT